MLNAHFSVPIPTDKIVPKKIRNTIYVYYVSGCKRVPGFKNPRPVHKLIGKVVETPNTMYPNNNYFEIYGSKKTSQIVIDKIISYGSYLLYDQIITSIGLKDLIETYFFGKSDYLLALSHYMFS